MLWCLVMFDKFKARKLHVYAYIFSLSVGARKSTQAKTYGKCEIGWIDNVKFLAFFRSD